MQEEVVKEKMNYNEKEKTFQEIWKNSPHLLDKFSPSTIKKPDKFSDSPNKFTEKMKMRKDMMKEFSLKSRDTNENNKKLLPKVKPDDVKLIAYELKLRFILKKIDINSIEKVSIYIISLFKFLYISHYLMKILSLRVMLQYQK